MNCKQGDLAVFVSPNNQLDSANLGIVVKILDEGQWYMGSWYWRIEPRAAPRVANGVIANWACDRCLRPIRGDSQHTDEPERIKVEA